MSSTDPILVEREGGVAVMTLNRPTALNSFDEDLHNSFVKFWIDAEGDMDLRAVVITGAGKAFSAGGNLDDFELFRTDLAARNKILRGARRIVDERLNVRVPVVAAVNGAAVGLGCTLMTLCDIVFLADDATIADPHVSVALVAGDGSAVTWPHLTSLMKAKQYIFTGDPIPPADAVVLGLANFVLPRDEVLPKAIEFAHRLAKQPPQAIQDSKSILNQHLRLAAVATLGFGLAAENHSHDTPECAAVPEQFRSRKKNSR